MVTMNSHSKAHQQRSSSEIRWGGQKAIRKDVPGMSSSTSSSKVGKSGFYGSRSPTEGKSIIRSQEMRVTGIKTMAVSGVRREGLWLTKVTWGTDAL